MRSLKWVSLAVLLAACGGEPNTGEQRSAELPEGRTSASEDALYATTDELRGDETAVDEMGANEGETDPSMPDSRGWEPVTGAALNDFLDVEGVERTGNYGGSASAAVLREDDVFAFADRDDANRAVVVWTVEGVSFPGGQMGFELDLEDVTPHGGWIAVTLSHRNAEGYSRAHCVFSPDGENAEVVQDNTDGTATVDGDTLRCVLDTALETGDLDVYIYPTAYRPDVGWDDRPVGEVFVSNGRLFVPE